MDQSTTCFFSRETCRPARRVFSLLQDVPKFKKWFPIRYELFSWSWYDATEQIFGRMVWRKTNSKTLLHHWPEFKIQNVIFPGVAHFIGSNFFCLCTRSLLEFYVDYKCILIMIGFDNLWQSPTQFWAFATFGIPWTLVEANIWSPSLRFPRSETVCDDHGSASFSFKFWPQQAPSVPKNPPRIPCGARTYKELVPKTMNSCLRKCVCDHCTFELRSRAPEMSFTSWEFDGRSSREATLIYGTRNSRPKLTSSGHLRELKTSHMSFTKISILGIVLKSAVGRIQLIFPQNFCFVFSSVPFYGFYRTFQRLPENASDIETGFSYSISATMMGLSTSTTSAIATTYR